MERRMPQIPQVKIWTDGACSPNPGPGGWAALLDFRGQRKQVFGYAQDTTNNRMELQAVIQGLMALKRRCKVTVYSDSRYMINGALGARRTVANSDLWDELRGLMAEHIHVGFVWIKGHNGTSDNELVNRLAQQQRDRAMQMIGVEER